MADFIEKPKEFNDDDDHKSYVDSWLLNNSEEDYENKDCNIHEINEVEISISENKKENGNENQIDDLPIEHSQNHKVTEVVSPTHDQDQVEQKSTGPTTGGNLLDTPKKEKEAKDIVLLNKKKNKEKNKEKGTRKDNKMQRVKANLFKNINKIVAILRNKSLICQIQKKFFTPINEAVYIVPGSKENIELLEKKLKDVYSEVDENNKRLIELIIAANDCPELVDFLEKTINELLDIFCGKVVVKEDYYRTFIDGYHELIRKIKSNKSEEYVFDFEICFKNLLSKYKEMNENGRKRKKKL
jgi:hypothetical protein